ncbi:MAG: oligosaccharide repeat unit polymerase [Oligoflexia bacterium]|nr:oligosaccharide repeat unit polymerase [Oligoflexia bacterium]
MIALIIIIFVSLLSIYISYRKFKDIFHPLSLLCCWWGIWCVVANFSITGVFAPSLHTSILVSMMILFLMVGGIVGQKIAVKGGTERDTDSEVVFIKRVLKIIFIIITPIILFYFFRAINIFFTEGIENYRMLVFGTKETPSILFKSGPIELLYYLLIYSLMFYSLLASIALYFQSQKRESLSCLYYLLYAILLNFLDAIMRLGRFNIYHILILLGLVFFYRARREKNYKKLLIGIIVGMTILSSIVGIGYFRDKNKRDLLSQLKIYLIEYHTVGFAIFDQELKDKNSYLQTHLSYGRGVLGGVDQLVGLLARKVGFKKFSAPVQEIAFNMQTQRVIGNRGRAEFGCVSADCPIRYNAFSTILYTFYLDAREFAFVIFPFILGLLTTFFYERMTNHNSIHYTVMFLTSFFIIFFSIFQSQIEAPATWITIFISYLLQTYHLNLQKTNLHKC